MSKLAMHRHGLPMAGLALAPRTTATERMRGGSWQRIRYRVMEQTCGLCAECQRQGRVTVAAEVDHVVPLAAGGSDDLANLQALCVECHRAKSAREVPYGVGGAATLAGPSKKRAVFPRGDFSPP